MDYYLKTTDETSLWESLEAAGLAKKQYESEDPLNKFNGETDWVPTGAFEWVSKVQLDIVGTIYTPTGESQEVGGYLVPVMQAIDGFHANLRANLTEEQEALLPLIEAPTTPHRVWA